MFKRTLLLALIFSLFLSSFGFVDAARGPRSNLAWPASPLGTEVTEIYRGRTYFRTGVDTPMIIQYFYEWIIVLGGLGVFIAFIWAGLLYMTSVGDANKMSEAKKKIKNALIGLVLMLSSVLIFHTINPVLTRLGRVYIPLAQDRAILGDQTGIENFIKAYNKCVALERVRERTRIELALPWPLPSIPICLATIFGGLPGLWPIYESFIPGERAASCEELRNLIIRPNNFPLNVRPLGAENYRALINILKLPGYHPQGGTPNIFDVRPRP